MSFVCHSYVIRMSFVCHSYVIRMSNVCTSMWLICHVDVTRMYSYVICMLLVYARILSVGTRMSSVCHSYAFAFHLYVTRMYLYVICMSLVCTRMSSICHSYVFVCHPYVTRMYSYVICMSLLCGFTVNFYYLQMLPVNRHNTLSVQMELSNDFQLIIYFLVLRMYRNHLHLTTKLDFDEICTGSFSIVWKCITGRNLVKFRFWEWVWYSQYKKPKKTLVSPTANSKPFLFWGLEPNFSTKKWRFAGNNLKILGRVQKF